MNFNVRLPGFEGVAAGQTATLRLPIGRKYHALFIAYAGVTLAQMTEIRVIANGKPIHRYTAAERDTINQFDGIVAAAGILTIPFNRVGLKTRAAEEETAINTGGPGFASLTVEIDIDAAAAAPAFAGPRAKVSAGDSSSIGTILHIRKYTRAAAGAGDFEISDLPFGSATSLFLNRVIFGTAISTALKLERNLFSIFDRSATLNSLIQTDGVRTPQANYFVLDPAEMGYAGDVISMINDDNNKPVSDMRFTHTVSGAGTITCIVETLGQLGD